jgi:nucleoside-diphosphate-sugar epimerase
VPLAEDAPLRELRFPYRADPKEDWHRDYDKILVEEHLMKSSERTTILRLPLVFGPGDHRRRLHEYLHQMTDENDVIPIDVEHARWRISRGYVANVAHAFVLATSERGVRRIYNVADERAHPEKEWIERIARSAKWKGRAVPTARESLAPDARKDAEASDYRQDWVIDTTRIREELGFRDIIDPDEAMQTTVEWERANPAGATSS